MPGFNWPRPPSSACGTDGALRRTQMRRVVHGTGWRINKPKGCWAGSRSALIVLGPPRVGGGKEGNRVRRDPLQGSGAPHEENHARETVEDTLRFTNTSTKRAWIAEMAREHPERVFTSMHHLIDEDWMLEAYRRTRKDAAAGIDGVTAADYELDLEARLADLRGRILSGSYQAPPVRRHYIPKVDGRRHDSLRPPLLHCGPHASRSALRPSGAAARSLRAAADSSLSATELRLHHDGRSHRPDDVRIRAEPGVYAQPRPHRP